MEKTDQTFSEYYDYFENIRRRLYSLSIVFIVFFAAGFFEAGKILRGILHVFNLGDATIVTTSPFQFLDLATKVGLYVAMLACLPLILYHTYDFLKDGLNKKEKKLFFTLMPIGLGLFVLGFAYSFTILYFYLASVSAINLSFGIKNIWDVSSFMSQIIWASSLLGLVFEFPIILTFLIRIGLVEVDYLKAKRSFSFAIIFIFVGFLPPPDIFSTIIQALPLLVLYELTIIANAGYSRHRVSLAEKIKATNVIHPAT